MEEKFNPKEWICLAGSCMDLEDCDCEKCGMKVRKTDKISVVVDSNKVIITTKERWFQDRFLYEIQVENFLEIGYKTEHLKKIGEDWLNRYTIPTSKSDIQKIVWRMLAYEKYVESNYLETIELLQSYKGSIKTNLELFFEDEYTPIKGLSTLSRDSMIEMLMKNKNISSERITILKELNNKLN